MTDIASRSLPVEYTPDQLPTYQDALAKNRVGTVPAQFHLEHPVDLGVADISRDRYLSAEFHQQEVHRMWKRVWQFACLEDDIPNVGDHIIYEIAGISVIVSRSAPKKLSAFYNACLHRGAALAETAGSTREFMCGYHGWRYGLDGTLTHVPASWDFPTTCPGKDAITPVRVATAMGMVFITMDSAAPPLQEYLAPLPEHFAIYPPMNTRKRSAWVRKIVPVNWKAAQEAFMEGYHLPTTHPQFADATMGYEMQYDGLGRHVTRLMTAQLVPNFIHGPDVSEQELLDYYTEPMGLPRIHVPEGTTARAVLAAVMRDTMKAAGLNFSTKSDPEVLDSPLYFVFPNLVIWGGYALPWIYRFRPNGTDPTTAIMEVFQLDAVSETAERTHVDLKDLGDAPFSAAPELGVIGSVLDQDYANMARQRIGFSSGPTANLRFSRYQESLIRFHHHTLDAYLAATR